MTSDLCRFFTVFISSLTLLGLSVPAAANGLIGGLTWGDNHQTVLKSLEKLCLEVRNVDVNSPVFPLARNREQHVLCYGLVLPGGTVEATAFVVADDKLTLIEARGGAVAAMTGTRTDTPSDYLGRKVFDRGELVVDERNDVIWLSSKQALHVNLFTWSNPYLATAPAYEQSAAPPVFFAFGKNYEELKPQFEQACPLFNIQPIKEPSLPSKPASQVQINCFGYQYAGFPRKIEAVFGDGVLELVWILTGKDEEERVRDALVETFGAAEFVGKTWEVFAGQTVALRKDKPEILMISEKLIPFFEKQLTTGHSN